MPLADLAQTAFIALAATLGAGLVLAVLAVVFGETRRTARAMLKEAEARIVFLFDDEDLIDATQAGRSLIEQLGSGSTDWQKLLTALEPTYPTLGERLSSLAQKGRVRVEAADDDLGGAIEAEYWDGLARISLLPGPGEVSPVEAISVSSMEGELTTLRALAEDAPQLIWRQDRDGRIIWANRAYLDLAEALTPPDPDCVAAWPPIRIFAGVGPAPDHGEASMRRVSIQVPGARDADWFEVTSLHRGSGSIHFAVDANGVVQAETARREFVQTLTKTFATLATGLAIFDRQRRLVMFNPALLDLTRLPVEFLSARPQIESVFDKLRELRVLPEPKDYGNWRQEISRLEAAAKDGTYGENWTLPDGQVYRVSGRPHPDGAIAFLFEDITAEVSLARRFRSEIELGQTVIDTIEDAVAVFSPSGTLIMSNAAYGSLWGLAAEDSLEDRRLSGEMAVWQSRSAPTPLWADLRSFAALSGQREQWRERIPMADGRKLDCRAIPVSGGALMMRFRIEKPETLRIADRIPQTESAASA